MINNITKVRIENLQLQIDQTLAASLNGYCFAIKLLNYYELKIMIGNNIITVLNDLNKLIYDICDSMDILSYKQLQEDKILILIKKNDPSFARKLARKIYSLSQLYHNDQLPVAYMNCRIVSVEFPKISRNAEEIYDLLNWVLACPQTPHYYFEYDPVCYNILHTIQENSQLNLLRKAIKNNSQVFAYQPIIDRETMKIHYYESLLRIPDNDNNFISVGPIIEQAESKGLIFLVDQTVLRMVVKELAENPDLTLAFNISNIGILDDTLLELAESLLQIYDVAPRLIIEITETSLNEDYERIRLFMSRLRKFGCQFALDDFGAGFTSFRQLQNIPLDIIKIDGSYVRNITSDLQCKYFVERLIKISEDLGIKTVAEFVENGEIAQLLIDMKVDGMQGNFFGSANINRITEYIK